MHAGRITFGCQWAHPKVYVPASRRPVPLPTQRSAHEPLPFLYRPLPREPHAIPTSGLLHPALPTDPDHPVSSFNHIDLLPTARPTLAPLLKPRQVSNLHEFHPFLPPLLKTKDFKCRQVNRCL